MTTILDEIVENTRSELAIARQERPASQLELQLPTAPEVRDFLSALTQQAEVALIAEVKRSSPSEGRIREDFDPVEIANTYQQHGAACVSCLTDHKYFSGHIDDLSALRQSVDIPILRKDFIIDKYQVLEARVAGADCILLIAECLEDCRMRELYFYASELGMESLIEIYELENLERVLKLEPDLIGVNNRNLKDMKTDIGHVIELSRQIPDSCLLVAESGIHTRADVQRLQDAGIGAMLIGTSLMQADDIGKKVDELLGRGTDSQN